MSFQVPIEISRSFAVPCAYESVFELLADVPRSVSHFPKVKALTDLGQGVFLWEMEPLGLGAYTIQTVYACAYTDSAEEGWVEWKPVEGKGTARIEGFWNLEEDEEAGEIQVEFYTTGELSVPLPSLARFVVAPLAAAEFGSLVDRYIANLQTALV